MGLGGEENASEVERGGEVFRAVPGSRGARESMSWCGGGGAREAR